MIVRKSDIIPDLGDGQIGIREQCLCQFHFSLEDIGFQGDAGRFLKKGRDIFLIISKIGSDFADLHRFPDPPGDIIHDIRIELLFIPFHGDAAAGQIELAVEFAQDPGYRIIVLVDIPVVAVAVLKLLEQYDHPVHPGYLCLYRQQDPGLFGWQGRGDCVRDAQIAVVSGIGKVRPVKGALGRVEAMLVTGGTQDDIFPLMDYIFLVVFCNV